MTDTSSASRVERPNRWVAPVVLLAIVTVVIVVFITSNTAKTTLAFAGL